MLEVEKLREISRRCRADILRMTTVAASGHPGGSMSSIDLLVALYSFANVDPDDPWSEDRDRVVVSHGHISPAVYATLAAYGFVKRDEVIAGFRHPSTMFEGHVTRGVPGVEWTTGNLGQGLSAGVGFALAGKLRRKNYHVFVLMSDGECAKGQVQEARRIARKYSLDNLTAIVDHNDIQISGRAREIMYVDIKAEFEDAGWRTIEIDGHDFEQILSALKIARNDLSPTAIIAHTVIGKGVDFMEDKPDYHGKPLTVEEFRKAIAQIGEENDVETYLNLRKTLPEVPYIKSRHRYQVHVNLGQPRVYEAPTDNRSALGRAIADLALLNENVVAIDCDLKGSVKLDFLEKERPDRLLEFGVQEHSAATVAGALSIDGFITFFADFGVFGVDETFNQHRLNAINDTNLKVAVTHCGIDVGEDGKTHHALNYVSGPLAWFGFKVVVPADPNQTDRVVRYVASVYGNFVIAVGRSKVEVLRSEDGGIFYDANYVFEYGKMDVLRDGKDGVIYAMGTTVQEALKCHRLLKEHGLDFAVVNVSCPLDLDEQVLKLYSNFVVTVEDHNVFNGLGALISQKLFELGILPRKFLKIGISDFPVSGDARALYNIYGLSATKIAERILSQL